MNCRVPGLAPTVDSFHQVAPGTLPDGAAKEYWTRMTVGYTKADDVWKMTHVHLSSPYDLASGQALVTLRP